MYWSICCVTWLTNVHFTFHKYILNTCSYCETRFFLKYILDGICSCGGFHSPVPYRCLDESKWRYDEYCIKCANIWLSTHCFFLSVTNSQVVCVWTGTWPLHRTPGWPANPWMAAGAGWWWSEPIFPSALPTRHPKSSLYSSRGFRRTCTLATAP